MSDNLSFYERLSGGTNVSIVSVPIELGSDERGLAQAPQAVLDAGLEKAVTALGNEVSNVETISCPAPGLTIGSCSAKYLDEIAAVSNASCNVVEKVISGGDTVVAIGGDHSMSIGTISGAAVAAAHKGKTMGVIYIDAHPDCNTDETSISGNIHGQVTAALMGYGNSQLTGVGGAQRKVAPENFVFIGLKDFDPLEIDFLRKEKAKVVTMLDIAERGLSRAILAIDALRRRVDTIWISMDMDSIDESDAPGVGLPMPGGLTRREVLGLAQYIGKKCNVAGFDLVEMLPAKDQNGKTVRLAIELAGRFLGGEYSWYQSEYMQNYRETNARNSVPIAKRNSA